MSKKNSLIEGLQLCGIEKNIETFQAGTIFNHTCNQIVLIITGVLHLENLNNQKVIITYLNGEYLLEPARFLQKGAQKYQLVCDTNIEIIRITQEEFKKLVNEKPSILEWLIETMATLTEKLITEFSKIHEKHFLKIQNSVSSLCKDGLLIKSTTYKEWYELPSFITREDFISYVHVPKRTFQVKLKELEENRLFRVENRTLFIHGCFLALK
ncbi:Crp/Fnr family transcriptional regulator [Listeria sp. FSL L7-1485]|uniref:Crp/Fnr family transcriptional regulator n=1 Tax=Listeria immobilis TaxID=2713502 RepID=A0A7X1CA34_9LIST|nr:Crp/Fnr family transcriptional regulator [Listeria immobilis]MBC1483162.1 Crp/Fnr family transcriptional regulator [Listeria immobilis]MBC1489993.1 Crp/Fnr family transcriptional regulator [Listeria immobilis]MBC1505984.1 Crp/Fnr family transcriptional regulator [Listeria immobilis]MBC1508628.1 Crp/Fnr family transcriptional regulator [Listeria immobilis]MBC1516664.1 Crp/Fnr family transcriptional regulator [Listeria immobilis]